MLLANGSETDTVAQAVRPASAINNVTVQRIFMNTLLKSARRPAPLETPVSAGGIPYGMLVAIYMGRKTLAGRR